ncbi:small acid-soluble spore protein H [Brevibacillus choshinensis]|uniref:small acid-soluble spore protein H n=1 Tax=Brevibacillus choshinensis TaxID=54911 RepID=UPI002E1DF090|nr:small acid-soluble spore protein H [Brevibacillus choshinensis]MED4751750.1 small acid-soluble spore protein H [Brevibacillus choshinensis]MED4780010.1 small acid-soluble spore protein H [Brevibacillus choshinensis]
MNKQRAKEIAASPVMANVTCDGIPVYIQHVDEESEMARIYALNQPENEQSVPVNSLTEHKID